jgi:hypothetical protein
MNDWLIYGACGLGLLFVGAMIGWLAERQKQSVQVVVDDNELIGKFFHVFDKDKTIAWTGRVIGRLTDDLFMVELGDFNGKYIINIREIASTTFEWKEGLWQFFDTEEDMNEYYRDAPAAHPKGEDDKPPQPPQITPFPKKP